MSLKRKYDKGDFRIKISMHDAVWDDATSSELEIIDSFENELNRDIYNDFLKYKEQFHLKPKVFNILYFEDKIENPA